MPCRYQSNTVFPFPVDHNRLLLPPATISSSRTESVSSDIPLDIFAPSRHSKMVTSRIPLNLIPKDFPEDQPVFMLSLLQWIEQAEYPEGSPHPPCSGQEAWIGRFDREISRIAREIGNFEWVYQGLPVSRIIGSEKWDFVALVKFANIGTFRNTIGSDTFAPAVLEHRDAALKNWKLLFFTSPRSNSHEDRKWEPESLRKYANANCHLRGRRISTPKILLGR